MDVARIPHRAGEGLIPLRRKLRVGSCPRNRHVAMSIGQVRPDRILNSCIYLHFFYYFAAYSLHDIGRFVLKYLHCLFTRK